MRKIVWIYWENRKNCPEPPYITLSRWTMLHNLRNCTLVIVTPDNVEKYLPGITNITNNIQVDIQGRVDRFLRKFQSPRKNIAVKCDVIRAHLLQRYGGIYIDADAIILDDLDPYFSLLNTVDFLCMKRASHGKNHISVGFYGANANSSIIKKYSNEQRSILLKSNEIHYNQLGGSLLTQIVNSHSGNTHYLDEKEIQPITFEDARTQFINKDIAIEDIIDEEQKIFMLFNGPFNNELKNWDVKELYESDILISKVFRKALPRKVFTEYYNHLQ